MKKNWKSFFLRLTIVTSLILPIMFILYQSVLVGEWLPTEDNWFLTYAKSFAVVWIVYLVGRWILYPPIQWIIDGLEHDRQ